MWPLAQAKIGASYGLMYVAYQEPGSCTKRKYVGLAASTSPIISCWNAVAARYSGIQADRVILTAYVILGGLTGLAAIVFAFYTNSVSPSSHGSFFELYGIAAAVLGGCSLRGGEGSVLGILLGTTLLQVLQNLVNLLGIPSSLNFAVMGGVILVGVVGDQLLRRRSARAALGRTGD